MPDRPPPRPRDELGRPLPRDARPQGPPLPTQVLSAADTLRTAAAYLGAGLPFHAHEVFELRWRSATAPDDRVFWRALAQYAAGVTQLLRGRPVGAARLLERSADALSEVPSWCPDAATRALLDSEQIVSWCRSPVRDRLRPPLLTDGA